MLSKVLNGTKCLKRAMIPTVYAPFLAIAPNQNSLSNCCMKALSHWPEMKNSGRCYPWNFTKNTVPTRVTPCAFIALQKFHSDHCLKHFCFVEYFFWNLLPVARAKQLSRSMKKTTSCKKATGLIADWAENIFCPISRTEFDHFWNWFGKNKFRLFSS